MVLCLFLFVSLLGLWLRRRVIFSEEYLSLSEGATKLHPEEKVEIRVTGVLEVNGKRHHFAINLAAIRIVNLCHSVDDSADRIDLTLDTDDTAGPFAVFAGELGVKKNLGPRCLRFFPPVVKR